MIRVQVTDQLITEARELMIVPHSEHNRAAKYTEEKMMIGALGEVALTEYCWNNSLLIFQSAGMSSDLQLYSGHKVEVKSQKCSKMPEMHYRVTIGTRQKDTEVSDFYFFTQVQFVAGIPECVWLLGGCSKPKFWRMAFGLKAGSPITRNDELGNETPIGRTWSEDMHLLPISSLAPPSAALNHFKSLQPKEEAQ
jgi:hypothetical protein